MVSRLTLTIPPDLREAIQEMSETDFRPPKEQILYLVVAEAKRRGILPTKNTRQAAPTSTGTDSLAGGKV